MRAFAPILLLASGCMSMASTEAGPPPPVLDPTRTEWRLHIDTKGKGIGAYTISIQWNPDVAVIERIEPCTPKHFKGTPMYEEAALKAGLMRITSFDTSGTSPRSGEWHLFTVIFRSVAPGALSARAELQKLYDSQSKPLAGRLIDSNFQYTFP